MSYQHIIIIINNNININNNELTVTMLKKDSGGLVELIWKRKDCNIISLFVCCKLCLKSNSFPENVEIVFDICSLLVESPNKVV